MGINKYGTAIPGRSSLFLNYLVFNDLAILEHGTQGHMVFNFGQYFQSTLKRRMEGVYNTSAGEMDLVLGVDDRLYEAAEEAVEDGYKNLLLMPSALADVMGFDLEYYSSDISSINSINCFTAKINGDADFYEGEEAFYNSLIKLLGKNSYDISNSFSIIGDTNSFINSKKHKEIRRLIESTFNMETSFDSLELQGLASIEKLKQAKITIVTTKSALGLAKYLMEEYEIPYYYFNSLDIGSINNDLANIANLLNVDNYNPLKDEYYDGVAFQFKNIVDYFDDKKIILYLNVDNLIEASKLLDSLDIKYEAIVSHKHDGYSYMSIDEVIDKFNSDEYFVIGNDIITKYIKASVAIEYIRLEYSILTPIEVPFTLLGGAYKLMKLISDRIFNE